jgi:hypothetical protein
MCGIDCAGGNLSRPSEEETFAPVIDEGAPQIFCAARRTEFLFVTHRNLIR